MYQEGIVEQSLRFSTVRLATGPKLYFAEQGVGKAILFLHGWPDGFNAEHRCGFK
jgi:hypothetical protein